MGWWTAMKTSSNDTIRSPKRKSEKLLIYQALLTLNQDFEQVLETLAGLEELTAFRSRLPRKFLKACRVTVEETRAGANFELVHTLQAIEERDWSRFGRLRSQLEDRTPVKRRTPKR
jgi:hypothetical protein